MMKQHSNRKVEGEEGWRVWGTLWGGSRGRKWGWNKVKDGLVYQKCPLSVMEKNRQRKKKKERKERMKKWKTDKRSTTEQQRYITLYKQHITFQRTFKQMKTNTPVRATTLHCGLWWKHGSLMFAGQSVPAATERTHQSTHYVYPPFQNPHQGQDQHYQKDCVHVRLFTLRGRQVGAHSIT